MNYYKLLGVDPDASFDQIKAAYRGLAQQLHPDRNPDPSAGSRFHDITEAYSVLSDPQKRQRYDSGVVVVDSITTLLMKTPAGIHARDLLTSPDVRVAGAPIHGVDRVLGVPLSQEVFHHGGVVDVHLEIDGEEKSFSVHVPSRDERGKHHVIEVLGLGGRPSNGGDPGKLYLQLQEKRSTDVSIE